MSRSRPATDALEARVAARLARALSAAQADLPPDTTERLRFARHTALERARAARRAGVHQGAPSTAARPAVVLAMAGGGGVAGSPFGAPVPWWQRAAALLPLVVLVAGLVGIDHWATQEQIATAAEIDLELLADDLPPEAYADPGFVEFLRDDSATPTP